MSKPCIAGSIILLLSCVGARACDCATPKPSDQAKKFILDLSDKLVFAEIVSVRLRKSKKTEPNTVYAKAKVLNSIKGTTPSFVNIKSWDGDNGANCGLGNQLLYLNGKKESISISLRDSHRDKKGVYSVGLCTSGVIE